MEIIVFTGPTLSPEEGRAELDATYLPPVAQGDLYRAALQRPWGIAIIDGFFERVPAVWHKEILWALSRGIHVFGASSMGALRAVELEPFGMEGVGEIFESFRSGVLEDDDEVAIIHGPPETGYRGFSEAMVDIRWTVAAAEASGVVSAETCALTIRAAKELCYPERTYPAILQRAERLGAPADEIQAFESWLPHGRIDQKRRDALALLRFVRARREENLGPKKTNFHFHHTDAWEQVRRQIALEPRRTGGADGPEGADVLEELRRTGDLYLRYRDRALIRLLAREVTAAQGFAAGEELLARASSAFWHKRRILDPNGREAWREEQGLTWQDLARLLNDEARLLYVEAVFGPDAEGEALLDQIRAEGRYAELLSNAADLTIMGSNKPNQEGCSMNNEAMTQEVRAQVERTMGAFVAMDLEGLKAGLAEDVVAFEIDLDGKPVRLGSRDAVARYAEEIFAEMKKMGASMKLNFHSNDCRADSILAYCTVEFDFKAIMADGSSMSQPSRNTIVLRKGDDGWKWWHWHTSLAVPAAPAAP